ncbi:Arginase/deacetylase [Violaceomyces palustris]|uniref:Arginase/deacetylase n=1 Tax=Violaceomyces palustris TaxID=1673888 RepID=A0ACD0P355_9BASI|nr:Arginase/deacetylase [Violaceomyces palustris]
MEEAGNHDTPNHQQPPTLGSIPSLATGSGIITPANAKKPRYDSGPFASSDPRQNDGQDDDDDFLQSVPLPSQNSADDISIQTKPAFNQPPESQPPFDQAMDEHHAEIGLMADPNTREALASGSPLRLGSDHHLDQGGNEGFDISPVMLESSAHERHPAERDGGDLIRSYSPPLPGSLDMRGMTQFGRNPNGANPNTSVSFHGDAATTASSEEDSEDGSSRFKSGILYDSLMMLHSNPVEEHPEAPERISTIFRLLKKHGCVSRMKRIACREVIKEEVALVHDMGMWEGLERSAFFGRELLAEQCRMLETTSSLYLNEHSALCARLSCGGTIEMCDAIASGRIRNGFAIVRPPGHHAEPKKSMGFCFYNNVAVATRFLQEKYKEGPHRVKKVLILDWDVHHGNGTQAAFWEDPNVLYISLHRYENGEFYPGGPYGGESCVGEGAGRGTSVNIPWPTKGMGDGDYLYAFQQIVMPIAVEYAPDFVIISAGFDAAQGDSIGQCMVTPLGYAHMTYMLNSLANGRMAVVLEGGYNVDAIAESALGVTKVILNEPTPDLPAGTACGALAVETVRRVARVQSRYWKSIATSELEEDDAEDDDELPKLELPEYLKAHRTYEMYEKYQLAEIPLQYDLEERFRGQAFCNEDVMDGYKTVVLFAHDMGNIRIDKALPGAYAGEELAYLVDSSSKIIEWAKSKGYGIVDVNIFSQLPTKVKSQPNLKARPGWTASQYLSAKEKAESDLLLYVWDNIVELSSADNIILIGHGTACRSLMNIIAERSVDRKVKAVVQVLGQNEIPKIPPNRQELRKWYWNNSKVILPVDHPNVVWGDQENLGRRLGRTEKSHEQRAIKVLISHQDDIFAFIETKLAKAKRLAKTAASVESLHAAQNLAGSAANLQSLTG